MSDSEGSGSDASESSPARSHGRSSGRRRRRRDESDEDEEDEEEYDSEEEEEYEAKPKKKKKKSDFIIDEAEVDDDVEDDEEGYDDYDATDLNNEAEEAGQTAREIDARMRAAQRDHLGFGRGGSGDEDGLDEEEIERYYNSRYNEEQEVLDIYGDAHEKHMSEEITQQTMLPGVKDPNLWMVKCVIGMEKETVLRVMNKYFAHAQDEATKLQIRSVVAHEHVKGYIYIEAFKQSHVKELIDGIGSLRLGSYSQKMVPIKEMTDVLRVMKKPSGILKPKQWVRLKRGIHKDDLAQVDYVDTSQNSVHLKLLPRIDYTRLRGALRTPSDESKKIKKKSPPAKLFDPEKIRSIGGEISHDGDFLMFEGNRYSRKGYLYKDFAMNAIISEGVKPTLAELEKFEETPEGLDIELSSADKDDVVHSFSNGDNVEVMEGELVNLQGKVIAIDGGKVTILPKHDDLKEPIEFQASELRKFFSLGNRVRVIGGRYEGDTGLIVRVQENLIVLFSDLTMHELKVLPRDLQLCTDMATGVDSLGQFQFGDMVQIDSSTVGVIVQIQKENFQVLNMMGKVVSVKPQALQKKRENRNAVAIDSEQNQIIKKDVVKVIDGPHNGLQGEIRHLFRSFAFLHSRKMIDNGGIFVCKCRHLVIAGGKNTNQNRVGGSAMPGFMSPRLSSPMHPSQSGRGAGGGGAGRGRGRGRGVIGRDRELIGKTIKITQGPYKSHIGIVKDATESTARVELHAKCQTISVDRGRIEVIGTPSQNVGSVSTYTRTPSYGSGSGTPMYAPGSRTPMYGSQTPMYDGSRTPHYGSTTPSHEDGSRTPGRSGSGAWDPSVTNTPAPIREYDFDGQSGRSGGESSSGAFDDSPSPNYNPGTPGYAQESPSAPYTPATPGSVYNPGEGYSPYQASPSPAGYQSTPSPSSYVPTPSPGQNYQPSPSPGYAAPSPGLGYSPMTPGSSHHTPSPYAATPGQATQSELESTDWYSPDIEVLICDTHDDTRLVGQIGVVRGVTPGMCSVYLPDEYRTVSIAADHLQPVKPVRGDKVKVIMGEDRDATGSLLSIDSQEGVVKLEIAGDVKMLQLKYLCKMKSDD
uniref:Transcription elongation factor SPT5 n=1 Tax=Lepeophtheirus salmonis TaxID=72036 RepID=A0A0K2T674_LEPSM